MCKLELKSSAKSRSDKAIAFDGEIVLPNNSELDRSGTIREYTSQSSWTDGEILWLRLNYSNTPWEQIVNHLNRPKRDIIAKAHELKVRREKVQFSLYTEEEDEIIRKYWTSMSISELQSKYLPHRTVSAITNHAYELGLRRGRTPWSKFEDEILLNNFKNMSHADIQSLLPNRSYNAIYNRIRKLGLRGGVFCKYTEDEISFIKNNFKTMSDAEIAKHLNKAPASIKEYRRKLGIRRKPEGEITHYASVERFLHRNNERWRCDSMNKCGYRCVVTGAPFDVIHHLFGKNMIIKETFDEIGIPYDFDINTCGEDKRQAFLGQFISVQSRYPLGVCLTKEMHKLFHKRYGYGYNTPEQFYEFVNDVAPDKIGNLTI